MDARHHPRRRPANLAAPLDTLRKSNTFNLRTKGHASPLDVAAWMPKRSPTDPKSLDLLLNSNSLDSHGRDVAKLLKQFDQHYYSKESTPDASILSDQDVLAVPSFMLNRVAVPEPMDVDKKPVVNHHHGSDSGIGSSVTSSRNDAASTSSAGRFSTISLSHSTITKSASALGSPPHSSHVLSAEAARHIRRHIVQPILREPSLKEFHPLIADIPRRIGDKNIANLRDLEKTLFFLAPDFSKSPKSFLQFCETSIQCLQTTSELLCERDQRRPTDRPYTNTYFIDLVEQIRRYAEIMARTREKKAKGEALDEKDYASDEEITLEGGLSKNGKPAELVRNKNGKVIPLSDHSNLDAMDASSSKRPFVDDEDDMDDDVMRSMARRRKSDRPGDIMHPCRACDKEFKRPCDLTKHEKTHSRPWKCSDSKCRYHELGWPTEKERDRHVNDKHSSAPMMYKCKYNGCSYASKRESNCKQHMEKSHGWEYVRSKSNGRKKGDETTGGSSSNRTPATPLTPFMATPASDANHLATPNTPFIPSPSVPLADNFFGDFRFATGQDNLFGMAENLRRESVTTAGSGGNYSSDLSPDQSLMHNFSEAVSPDDIAFNHGAFDASAAFNFDFSSNGLQQPTPALSTGNNFSEAMDFSTSSVGLSNSVPHLSPIGQGDLTLYSPSMDTMNFDEGLGDDMNFDQDFQLFDASSAGPSGYNSTSMMNWAFPESSGAGGQFDTYSSFADQAFADPSMNMFPQ